MGGVSAQHAPRQGSCALAELTCLVRGGHDVPVFQLAHAHDKRGALGHHLPNRQPAERLQHLRRQTGISTVVDLCTKLSIRSSNVAASMPAKTAEAQGSDSACMHKGLHAPQGWRRRAS